MAELANVPLDGRPVALRFAIAGDDGAVHEIPAGQHELDGIAIHLDERGLLVTARLRGFNRQAASLVDQLTR